MKRGVIVIGLGAMLALGVLVAGAEAPWTDDTLSVEAAVAQACATTQSQDYDIVDTFSGDGVSGNIETSNSGDDLRRLWTWRNADGDLLQKGEQILKDGTMYMRFTVEGDPETWEAWEMYADWPHPGHPPCLPADTAFTSSKESSGERRFTSTVDHGEQATKKTDLWVNSSGQLLRDRKTFTTKGEAQPHTVLHGTYSGFGEPNVITAPVIDP